MFNLIEKIVCLFCVLYFCLCPYQTSALDPNKPVDRYILDKWKKEHGLPSTTLLSIAQTPDGYMWFSTPLGLVKFDGIKFSTIRHRKNEEVKQKKKTPYADTLFVDTEGNFWLGGIDGLINYHYKTGQFTAYTKKDGLAGDWIWCINEDVKGNLWLGFNAAYLNRFKDGTFTWFNAESGVGHPMISSIIEDMRGNLLIGSYKKGVYQFRDETFIKYEIEELRGDIHKLYEDRRGVLWIGTDKGLLRVETDKVTDVYTTADGLSNDYIWDITEDSDENLWVGTRKGLNRMEKDLSGKVIFKKLLENHFIHNLFEDKEKNLWVCTYDSGIMRLKNPKFSSHVSAIEQGSRGEIMISIFEDHQGNTWIGSLSGKLYKYGKRGVFVESMDIPGIQGMGIYALEEDDKGNLWLGTRGKGVFQKKGQRFINYTSSNGLANNLVNSIFIDSKKNLWFGTYNGVTRYKKGKFLSYKTTNGLQGKIVYNIYEDKNHLIWIAGNKGITVLKNGEFTRDTNTMIEYLQGIPVTCIFEDPGENVSWIGTHGAGLKRFTAGKFTSYTTTNGMTTNFIYQIFDDEKQNLWMTSDTGVLRISKKELHRFARGEIDRVNCTSFGKSDGMKSLQFHNQFSRNSAVKTRAGEFLFVTKKGIMNLDPEEIIVNKSPPNVVIERVVSNGKNLPLSQSHLPEENVFKGIKDIEFHFTAPTFLSPEKVTFKYKLERHNPDWVFLKPGAERTVQFKNLPYDTYTFRVTACNSDGVWNSFGTSLSFALEPFLHETLAFKIAVFFILVLLLSGGYLLHKMRLFDRIRKYKNSSLEPSFVEKHSRKLAYLMDIERVYRDENTSLQSLAEKLSLTPHQLSQIINKKFNKNFRDFINSFRIEEAKRILCDPERADEKIFSVGYAVGFNTKVAFNSAFKRHTKMTPSEYKKKYEKNKTHRS